MDRSKITILLVSFYSLDHLKRITKELRNNKIIIIDNSREKKVEEYFKSKKNIKVIFPKKNLGYGCGNNLGIKKSKTKFCIILNPDTFFSKQNLKQTLSYIKKIDDFGILLPRLDNNLSKKPFIKNKENYVKANYKYIGYSYASGCAMVINKSKFKNTNIFDNKIFLYKEETDLIKRCNDNKIPCYLLRNAKVKHFGTKSLNTKKISSLESDKFRNWHWTWSNFYFYKKHFGFSYAFIKFFRSIFSSLCKTLFYYFFDYKKHEIYKARLKGFLASIFGKRSTYRMQKLV